MPFTVEPTPIPEVLVVRPRLFPDERGWFAEIVQAPAFEALGDGLPTRFVQVNQSRSARGVIRGGPGDVIVNGAAARLVHSGDKVIVISYAHYNEAELEAYAPLVVHVDEDNRPIVLSVPDVLDATP